ncbi:hypothetical protein GEMRC1_006164 [Eukaryota sp. GEM-RC1]
MELLCSTPGKCEKKYGRMLATRLFVLLIEKSAKPTDDPLELGRFACKTGKLWSDIHQVDNSNYYYDLTLSLCNKSKSSKLEIQKTIFAARCWRAELCWHLKHFDELSTLLQESNSDLTTITNEEFSFDVSSERLFLTSMAYNFGTQLYNSENYDQCIQILKSSGADEDNLETSRLSKVLRLKACCFLNKQHLNDALHFIEASLSLEKTVENLLVSSKVLYGLKRNPAAQECILNLLDMMLNNLSQDLSPILAAVETASSHQDYPTAEKVLKVILDRDKSHSKARASLLSIYIQKEDQNASLQFLDQLIAQKEVISPKDPIHALIWKESSSSLQKGQSVLAVEWLKRAISIVPETDVEGQCMLRRTLSRALLDQGEVEEALVHVDYADRLMPDKPETLFIKILIHYSNSNTEEAICTINALKTLALSPDTGSNAEVLLAAAAQEVWRFRNSRHKHGGNEISYAALCGFFRRDFTKQFQ